MFLTGREAALELVPLEGVVKMDCVNGENGFTLAGARCGVLAPMGLPPAVAAGSQDPVPRERASPARRMILTARAANWRYVSK